MSLQNQSNRESTNCRKNGFRSDRDVCHFLLILLVCQSADILLPVQFDRQFQLHLPQTRRASLLVFLDNTKNGRLKTGEKNKLVDTKIVGSCNVFAIYLLASLIVFDFAVANYLWMALTPAFPADDHPQLIKQITLRDRKVKPLRQIDDSIPFDLETIVGKAMSFEPASRFQSADEMADELERYLDGLPIKSRPTPLANRLWSWAKRKPTAAALVALISMVACIGLPIAIWLWLTASSALSIAEAEREHATQMQMKAEDLSRDAEASRYSSGMLLASNYIDDGQASDAKRLLAELEKAQISLPPKQTTFSDRWELDFLKQQLDTSSPL